MSGVASAFLVVGIGALIFSCTRGGRCVAATVCAIAVAVLVPVVAYNLWMEPLAPMYGGDVTCAHAVEYVWPGDKGEAERAGLDNESDRKKSHRACEPFATHHIRVAVGWLAGAVVIFVAGLCALGAVGPWRRRPSRAEVRQVAMPFGLMLALGITFAVQALISQGTL